MVYCVGMDNLDAVMAEHRSCATGHDRPLCHSLAHASQGSQNWPCLTYRLAAALAAAQERKADAWEEGYREGSLDHQDHGLGDQYVTTNPYRAALTGEGVRDDLPCICPANLPPDSYQPGCARCEADQKHIHNLVHRHTVACLTGRDGVWSCGRGSK